MRTLGVKDMKCRESSLLVGLLMLYAAASFLHFAHNAEYLNDYPNLPSWFTRSGVYLAWAGLASLGAVGCVLYLLGWRLAGLLLLGLYATFGFDGLLHYIRAPIDAHSGIMNFTILFEVAAAAALLFAVVLEVVKPGLQHGSDA
jgi:hypothetical protein